MGFPSEEENKSHDRPGLNKSTRSRPQYKKKNIKKRRKARSTVHIVSDAPQQPHLDEFLRLHGSDYFSLCAKQAKELCNRNFRSFVHIKNIIGQQHNVFNLKNYSQAPTLANKYLQLCRLAHRRKIKRLRIGNRQHQKIVKCILQKQDAHENNKISFLDGSESILLEKRQATLVEVDRFLADVFQDRGQAGMVDPAARQIITLCKLNNIYELEIKAEIQRLLKNQSDPLYEAHQNSMEQSKQLERRYCELIVRKNLNLAFDESPLDYLNYFRQKDIEEQSIEDDSVIDLLENAQQFKKYLKIKKPNLNRCEEDQLKTACAACFSNCNETYNEIQRCPQCGMRLHRLCHVLKGKCQKCKYTRKTTEQKSHKPYCFICLRDKQHGLSIEAIKDDDGEQQFAHSFCLLISNCWSFQENEIEYHLDRNRSQQYTCSICNKQGGTCIKGESGQLFHGLCAYLEGYSMILQNEKIVIWKSLNHSRLAFQRHYRLNFQKTLYRRTQEILEIIQPE